MLDDPARLAQIKNRLKVGQSIQYFEDKENRLIEAEILEIRRTRLLIRRSSDGQRWTIPLYFVNLDGADTELRNSEHGPGIDRNRLKVGDTVGFRDRRGNELYGEVVKLNRKTATVLVNGRVRWRVGYRILFPVIDGERAAEHRLIEGQIISRE
jgi:hypothetical protein